MLSSNRGAEGVLRSDKNRGEKRAEQDVGTRCYSSSQLANPTIDGQVNP